MMTNNAYDEFKYFKDIYTTLNKLPEMELISRNGVVSFRLHGGDDSDFYILRGELYGDTTFLKWLRSGDGVLYLSTDTLSTLGKTLKKNAISVQPSENKFTFEYATKDQGDTGKNTETTLTKFIYKDDLEIGKIAESLVYTAELPVSAFGRETTEIYLDGASISTASGEKLLEIPTKKILSIVKDASKCTFAYSDATQFGRYVSIKSSNKSMMLEQIFKTI